MARAFILSPKLSDAGVITASTSISNAPAVNLLRARPKLFWRSTGNMASVEGTFGSTKLVDTLVMGYINGVTGVEIFLLRLASSQANLVTAPSFEASVQSVRPVGSDVSAYAKIHRVLTFAEHSCSWYRVDFNYNLSVHPYVQASRIIVGKRIEPLTSVGESWSMGGEEPVAETVDMGGEESSRIMGTKRTFTATWNNLTESEREKMYTTLLERGSAKDLVLAIEESEGIYGVSRVYIGRVKHAFSFPQVMLASDGVQRFTVQITISELAPIEMA